jgi:ribose 5-phosphate isomerase A
MEVGLTELEAQKRAAAERAVDLVRPHSLVGLGSGTTARYFIEALARRVRDGLAIRAVVTSEDSRRCAEAGGIAVVDDVDQPVDLDVDGADEIDPKLNCIKGRGGALLREKIVAHASRRFVLIADERKLVPALGRTPVPIEVLPFLWQATSGWLERIGGHPQLRLVGGTPFRTDNQNLVLDTRFTAVDSALAERLDGIPGVLGHGLFFGMATGAIIGGSGGTRVMGRLE